MIADRLRRSAPARAACSLLLALAGAAGAQRERAAEPQAEEGAPEDTRALAPACAGPAVLVTLDGESVETARGFEVDGTRVVFRGENGTLVAVRLAEIDRAATEAAERIRCGSPGEDATARAAQTPRAIPAAKAADPVEEVIDALAKLGVQRKRLEALAPDRAAFRAAVDAVVEVATELEARTREIERTYRLDTVGGMIAAAPAYRQLAEDVRDRAARERDPRVRAVIADLALSLDEVARLAVEEPERAIEEFERQSPPP